MQSHAAVAESWNEVLQWALIRSSWLGINWNTLAAKMSQNQEEHVIIDLNEVMQRMNVICNSCGSVSAVSRTQALISPFNAQLDYFRN